MKPKLIYIAGPTGVGKTALTLSLAKHYQTEIVSCDSRQFYSEMSIGTAVPSPAELAAVPHHFIQNKSIKEPVNVGAYEKEALATLEKLFQKNTIVFLTGGSGLFAQALMKGLDVFPPIPHEIKAQMDVFHKTHGLQGLQELLRDQDPNYYNRVDRQNPLRLIRALEVCFASGAPYSSFLGKNENKRAFESQVIVLHQPREALYERINKRVDDMIDRGLEEEVIRLREYKDLSSLKTVGYQEWWDYFAGKYDRETTIETIKKNTRRYAKRQITWFKRYGNDAFFPANTPLHEFSNAIERD